MAGDGATARVERSLFLLRAKRRSAPGRERLTLDERVVALDPAVRAEDENVEPHPRHLAVRRDGLPVELDDVAESLGVVSPPALIVDGLWNLIEANRAASLLWDGVDPELLEPPINMLRLGVHPGGLPKISSMTAACNAPLITKLRRRSREDANPALGELIEDVESYLPRTIRRPAPRPSPWFASSVKKGEESDATAVPITNEPLR